MFGALWGGAYVLNFFGVSLAALRIAGGTVVALSALAVADFGGAHPDGGHSAQQAAADAEDEPMQWRSFP